MSSCSDSPSAPQEPIVPMNVANAIPTTSFGFAALIGQYTNTAAMVMVGWILYQTIGVEMPAMREQTYVRTQAIITTMERMRDVMDANGRTIKETQDLNKEMMRMHMEQTKVLSELAREIRDIRSKRGGDGSN